MSLTRYEQETIINFNKDEDVAYVFTYEMTWQRHIETRLGIKPKYDNGKGGREYVIPKSRISMPKAPRKPRNLSPEARKKIGERLQKNRIKRGNKQGNK